MRPVAKAFDVLRAFGPTRPAMTITGVAAAAGLDRGTALRFVDTLRDLGFPAAVAGTRGFRLALRCLELGYAALSAGGLRAQSAHLLRDLAPDTVVGGTDVVCAARVQVDMGRQALDRRVDSRTGAHAAALGHAILAWQPPGSARAILASADRVRLSDRTLVDLDAMCDRLAEVRARGHAVSDGENAYGLRTMAAPVPGPDGTARAAVSLTAWREDETLDALVDRALPPLLRISRTLSRAVHLTEPSG